MLAGMALDLSPWVAHKSHQESGWTKGVTSGGGTACTELPSKTQSADRRSREDSWGRQLGTGQPGLRAPPFQNGPPRWVPGTPNSSPLPWSRERSRRAPSRASASLTGCGLRSEGLQGRPARGYRAGGSAPQPRSAPRSRSALPAAAPRLPSAHPRPLQCPGSFSRRPAGCAGLCLGLVFLSFGERGRIQWESGPLGGGPGVPARSGD